MIEKLAGLVKRIRQGSVDAEADIFEMFARLTRASSITGIQAADLLQDYLKTRFGVTDDGDGANIIHILHEGGVRFALPAAGGNASCPYKGPFGCKCEPGECKYTHGGGEAATPRSSIDPFSFNAGVEAAAGLCGVPVEPFGGGEVEPAAPVHARWIRQAKIATGAGGVAQASGDCGALEDLISTFEQMRGYPEGDSDDPCFDLCGMPCCNEFGCLHAKVRAVRALTLPSTEGNTP